MPELPEIETITKDLNKHLSNTVIKSIEITPGYSLNVSKDDFVNAVQSSIIKKVDRTAKNIIFVLDNGYFIQIHLAMTGRLVMRSPSFPKDKHLRVNFILDKDGKDLEARFSDMRMFGKVQLLSKAEYMELTKKYGPEPLDKNLTPQDFHAALTSKKTNVKNVMLDQSKISGMGNVYVIDALWIAKIHPETNTQTITFEQAETLLNASREILNEGIKNRGISMSDYVDAFGKKGNQQNYFRIYQQEVCPTCTTKVTFKKINGRGTYFCEVCQTKDNQDRLI